MTLHSTYYLWREGQEEGPIEWIDLKRDYQAGQILGAVLVRGASSEDWRPIEDEVAERIIAETPRPAPKSLQDRFPAPLTPPDGSRISADRYKDGGTSGTAVMATLLIMGGIAAFLGVVVMETSADGSPVENLGRLNLRTCLCIFAAALFVGGCTLAAGAAIIRRLEERK